MHGFGMLSEATFPALVESFEGHFLLGPARHIEGMLTRSLPGQPVLLRMGVDLLGALRHVDDQSLGDTPDLEQPLARVELDIVAALAQEMREFVAIDLTSCHLLGKHGAGFETDFLLTVPLVGDVHDDDMGVEVGIEFA